MIWSAPSPPRRGFTLVEMLVVIFIIAILAALLVPVVGGALQTAQKTRNAQEIAQLMIALDRYKSENGGQYPPSFGEAKAWPGGATTYNALFGNDNPDLSGQGQYRNTILYRYLTTAFPRIHNRDIRYVFKFVADRQDQSTALVFWLAQTSGDPRFPFTNQKDFRSYIDFDKPRATLLATVPASDLDNNGTMSSPLPLYGYRPPYAKESYYAYLEARHYQLYFDVDQLWDRQSAGTGNDDLVARAGDQRLRPFCDARAVGFQNPPFTYPDRNDVTRYVNPQTYQLHCAGLDGRYNNNVTRVRLYPSGTLGLRYQESSPFSPTDTIPAEEFISDRDNQTNFSEGRTIEDVVPQ